MKPVALAILLVLSLVILTGCGQKGPLYRPGHNPNPPQPMLDHPAPDKPPDHGNNDKADQSHTGDGADNASYPQPAQ